MDDVVRATYLASQQENHLASTFNLSGSESISVLDLARMVKELVPESTSNIVFRDAREGDVRDSIGSVERTSEVLGFSPTIPFRVGLDRTVSWYRSHY